MVTKANSTVLDLESPIVSSGHFEELLVFNVPMGPTDAVNKTWAEDNFVPSANNGVINNSTLKFHETSGPYDTMEFNVGHGDAIVGPDIQISNGDGSITAEDHLYLGFDSNDSSTGTLRIHHGSTSTAGTKIVGEFGDGWLRITRPDQPGDPDDPVYLLLDQQPSGTPAPGGATGPAIIFHNPDNPVQGNPYSHTKIVARDDKILAIEADINIVSGGETLLLSIMQNPSVFFDFHGHLLKNALDPVDPQDLATKAYTDAVGGASAVVSSSLTDPGYIQYGNGFTIQWGTDTTVSTPEVKVFPLAFTTAFVVVTTPHTSPNDMSAMVLTPTTYQVEQWTPGGIPTTGIPYNFIAIGII